MFTDIFNQPKYKGWYVVEFLSLSFFFSFAVWYHSDVKMDANLNRFRAVVSAGPYRDISEEGKFYAVLLEQTQNTSGHASYETHMGTP